MRNNHLTYRPSREAVQISMSLPGAFKTVYVDTDVRAGDTDQKLKYQGLFTDGDETMTASSENYPKRSKMLIPKMNHDIAIGKISMLYRTIDVLDINSPIKVNGSKMEAAVFKDFP